MSSRNKDHAESFIAGKNILAGNKSLSLVHSDVTLGMYQEAQFHELQSRKWLILQITILLYEQSLVKEQEEVKQFNQAIEDEKQEQIQEKHLQIKNSDEFFDEKEEIKKITEKYDRKKKKEHQILPYGSDVIPDKFYFEGIKWYEEEFKPQVIKTLKSKVKDEKEKAKIVNEFGWIFLLNRIRYPMEYKSQQDLNKYARENYSESTHLGFKIPSVKYDEKVETDVPQVPDNKSK